MHPGTLDAAVQLSGQRTPSSPGAPSSSPQRWSLLELLHRRCPGCWHRLACCCGCWQGQQSCCRSRSSCCGESCCHALPVPPRWAPSVHAESPRCLAPAVSLAAWAEPAPAPNASVPQPGPHHCCCCRSRPQRRWMPLSRTKLQRQPWRRAAGEGGGWQAVWAAGCRAGDYTTPHTSNTCQHAQGPGTAAGCL